MFLLDDHEIVRRGIADLIASAPGIEVVGDAAEKTVKHYVSSLLAELNLQRRTQAAVLATEVRRDEGRSPRP